MRPDFARIKGVPLEVVLLLNDICLEDEAARYLSEEFGVVTASGHEDTVKLVLQNPDNPQRAYFRVRVRALNHSRRPFLDFKYLRTFYESEEFPGDNPMKEVLVRTYVRFRERIIGITNHSLEECEFPYELPVSPKN